MEKELLFLCLNNARLAYIIRIIRICMIKNKILTFDF